jgi:hypothetical protein
MNSAGVNMSRDALVGLQILCWPDTVLSRRALAIGQNPFNEFGKVGFFDEQIGEILGGGIHFN